jgi:hypothetical protein
MAALVCVLAWFTLQVGCTGPLPDREARIPQGYVYYCDGAGGGGLMNWAGGLRDGLKNGGYPGAGEIFPWNTGRGVVADQEASVEYKRDKARQMAQSAAKYSREHPGAPVVFIGLSAGTTVAVFGLEEMPANTKVDNVVLCGASISSTYDLTRALRNLGGKMYVFTSEKDGVLGFLVPMAGTADRADGSVPSAGLRGFRIPSRGASSETRQLYAKVVQIPWRPEYARLGYAGGHTDVLSSPFVAAHIAPLITGKVGSAPAELASTEGKVRNPDYERWAGFGVGTYDIVEGHQEFQGVRTPVRLKAILKSRSPSRLLVDREFYLTDEDAKIPAQVHSLIAEAWIDPKLHPTTHPQSKFKDLPPKQFTVKGRTFTCPGRSIDADGSFPDWGSDITATTYRCPDLPGGLVSLEIESHFQGKPFKFDGKIVDFNIVRD